MTAYGNYNSQNTDAVERYRYLLRTASPDQIEQAHREAFARMAAEERQQVLRALAQTDEVPTDSSPNALARPATRLELRQPGAMDQILGQSGSGRALFGSLAAGFAGAAVFNLLFGRPGGLLGLFGGHPWFGGPRMGGFGGPGMGMGGFGGFGGGPGR